MGLAAIIIRFVQFEYCILFKDVTVIQGFHWTRIGQTILIRLRDGVDSGSIRPLPLLSFDMARSAQQAFRLLQRGSNIGKIVIRIAQEPSREHNKQASAIVTGGTSGLGLLTARWQADCGVRAVVLASRTGRLPVGVSDAQLLLGSGASVHMVARGGAV